MTDYPDSLVEAVARAIHDKLYEATPPDMRDESWPEMREQFMGEARAALAVAGPVIEKRLIAELWEPSAEMFEAGCRAIYGKHWDGPPDKAPGDEMKAVWREYPRKLWPAMLRTFCAETGREIPQHHKESGQ